MNIGHCQKGHESQEDKEGMGHRLERSLQDPPGRSGRNGPPTGAVFTRPAREIRKEWVTDWSGLYNTRQGDQEGMGHRLERSLQDPPGRSGRNGPPTGAVFTRPAREIRKEWATDWSGLYKTRQEDQEGIGHRLERSLQDPPGRSGRNGPPTGAVFTRHATSQREAAAKDENFATLSMLVPLSVKCILMIIHCATLI